MAADRSRTCPECTRVTVNTEGSRLIGYKSQHVASIHLAVHYPDENVYTLDILPDATVAILIMAVTCRGEDEASNTNGLANRLFGVGSSFFERISQEIGAVTFERSDSYYCVELISSDLRFAEIGARFVQLIREYKFLF